MAERGSRRLAWDGLWRRDFVFALALFYAVLVIPIGAWAADSGFSFTFSPDSTRIVTFDTISTMDTSGAKPALRFDSTACLWDAETGTKIAVLRGHTRPLSSAEFSPDGSRIVTSSQDTTARLWDGHSGALIATLSGHRFALLGADFSPDGTRIVTTGADDTTRLWDGRTGKWVATLSGKEGRATAAAFSPDSTRLVVTASDSLSLWDGHTGAFLAKLPGVVSETSAVMFSSDGARIAVLARSLFPACLWDGHTGKVAANLADESGREKTDIIGASSMAFSPDGTRIAIAASAATRLWDTHAGKLVATLQGTPAVGSYPIGIVRFSADSNRLVTGNLDRSVILWEGHSGARIAALQPAAPEAQNGSMDGDMDIALSADGTRLVTLDDSTASLRDVQNGTLIARLKMQPQGDSNSEAHPVVRFSPDSRRFLTRSGGSNNGTLWDGKTGKRIATLSGNRKVVLLR